MVLVTHQLQGSKVACPSRPLPWSKGSTLKQYVTSVHMVRRTDSCLSLKRNFSLSIGASRTRGLKVKHFKISAFKGTGQAGESGGRANNGSKVPKNSVNLSYAPKDNEENITECQNTDNNEIKKLFKKWLTMLRTQLPSQIVDNVLEEASACEKSEDLTETQSQKQSGILMVALRHFWSLDATIKIPLMIFIPWFLAVNVVYGAEVSKELSPLWIFGPLVVALYIKFFKGLCALYVFTFKQTVKVIKNLPSYYLVAYEYLAKGKLKEAMRAHIWQPIEDFKNMDYKEFSKRKLKVFQEWLMEKYIDFVESIWPYYCRTIRFLKRANLI